MSAPAPASAVIAPAAAAAAPATAIVAPAIYLMITIMDIALCFAAGNGFWNALIIAAVAFPKIALANALGYIYYSCPEEMDIIIAALKSPWYNTLYAIHCFREIVTYGCPPGVQQQNWDEIITVFRWSYYGLSAAVIYRHPLNVVFVIISYGLMRVAAYLSSFCRLH